MNFIAFEELAAVGYELSFSGGFCRIVVPVFFAYLLFQLYQNHSPIAGTANTPQCMKIPNLSSSYHRGKGLASKLSHVGSYIIVDTDWHFENANNEIKNTHVETKKPTRSAIFWKTMANFSRYIIIALTRTRTSTNETRVDRMNQKPYRTKESLKFHTSPLE